MGKSGMPRSGHKEWSLGLLLLCLLLLIPTGILLERIFPASTEHAAFYDLAVILQEVLLWLVPALLLRPWRMRRLGNRKGVLWLGLAALPLGMLVQLGASGIHEVLHLPEGSGQVVLPRNVPEWMATVLALVIIPAICEEAFFRGGLLVYLRDIAGPRTALVFGTVLFAMMHGSPAGLPAHLCIGLLCSLLMLATGRVWIAMLAHGGYNAMALLMLYGNIPVWLGIAGAIPLFFGISVWRSLQKDCEKRLTGQDLALTVVLLVLMLIRYLT